MLERLHARLGDFWWYSLMLFCACRAADLLNAFIGLWLVPKYIDPSELGALNPLAQFANFLAIPVAAFANTFRNELTRLSIDREFGKLKTLMRGVFVATAVFLFLAIVVARFLLPALLNRIRVAEGSLGLVIITASFVGAVAPIYSNALQALKKFKAQSLLCIVGAPVRLVTMLFAMPFRAITGYFVGQGSVPAFSIAASIFSLRKELSVKAEPYWSREILNRFARLFSIFAINSGASAFLLIVESTVLRQRLPDIDSAGYYMATRFSEIASFLSATITFTIFPFAAERASNGEDTRPLVIKSSFVNACFCLLLTIPFLFSGKTILSTLPHGDQYAVYWWAVPWLIGISALVSIFTFYGTVEFSANRFGYLKWYIPMELSYPVMLLLVSGHEYLLTGLIPHAWSEFLIKHNIYSLDTMLWWMTALAIVKTIACLLAMITASPSSSRSS